jgi:hypothetical protein
MVLRGCRFLSIEFLVMKGLAEGDRGLEFVGSGEGEFGAEHVRVNFVSHQEYQNFMDNTILGLINSNSKQNQHYFILSNFISFYPPLFHLIHLYFILSNLIFTI